ncbi:MAG: NADH-quinone oxidoreductase subunit G [Gammaproteobacteria bacterium]|nr:NADH-quinone oxidoreductase subunit G [Gammaproteobacteria bacterium]
MSAQITEDLVTIEVDGQPVQARKGAMLIDVTDAAGVYIPRFCYHKKLTVAANCRMCLVEVERAPKPQPACATPVMDGMKVFTKSPKAISGQQATMEFLLINHPLDCPICDQGGECELQDLALGYGSAVSQFTERKRVVRDKNIGPLVQTDMTRCIHCTRCVRFGEEIAGLRELGATGRGEDMEIGTYVAQAMVSELSGNVIDLCPVGALTSKPYRYSARAWELQQHDAVAIHDCVGSNVHVHAKGQVLKRVVPMENEGINETWISDRDRFSYQGLRHEDRLLTPRIKENGAWRECDWETALVTLEAAVTEPGKSNRLGALAAPSSTCEEMFLLQRFVRGLGSANVDHRLRQHDFSGDSSEPRFPSLGFAFSELEQADTIVIVGGYPRHDQPLINHRLRKAALRGAQVIAIDSLHQEYNFDLSAQLAVAPSALVAILGAVTRAVVERATGAGGALAQFTPRAEATRLAELIAAGQKILVVLGNRAQMHAERSRLFSLAATLVQSLNGRSGQLTDGANAAGAWLAGAVPHRGPGGREAGAIGYCAARMLTTPLDAYLLLGFEPDRDCSAPATAVATLVQAKFVAALTAFTSPTLEQVAHLLLPIASFGENEGSLVNASGAWQTFVPAVKAPGSARAAWKILRALGDRCGLPGFTAVTCADITTELKALCGIPRVEPLNPRPLPGGHANAAPGIEPRLELVVQVPLNRTDSLVRRASALQQMPQVGDEGVHLSPATLATLKLQDQAQVLLNVGGADVSAIAMSDSSVPDGCCLIYATTNLGTQLTTAATVTVRGAGGTR